MYERLGISIETSQNNVYNVTTYVAEELTPYDALQSLHSCSAVNAASVEQEGNWNTTIVYVITVPAI